MNSFDVYYVAKEIAHGRISLNDIPRYLKKFRKAVIKKLEELQAELPKEGR